MKSSYQSIISKTKFEKEKGKNFAEKEKTGHLTGCGGADPHNSLTSASSAFSEHFPHKTEKCA